MKDDGPTHQLCETIVCATFEAMAICYGVMVPTLNVSIALPATSSLFDFAAFEDKLEAALLENTSLHRENQLSEVVLQAPKVKAAVELVASYERMAIAESTLLGLHERLGVLMSW